MRRKGSPATMPLKLAQRLTRTLRRGRASIGAFRVQNAQAVVKKSLRRPEPEVVAGPLIVSGLLAESKGISQGARLTIAALRAGGLYPVEHELRPLLAQAPGSMEGFCIQAPGGVWFSHVNAPEAAHILSVIHPKHWRGRYRIGYWAWELARAPKAWSEISKAYHEIWVPSQFVVDSMVAAGVQATVRLAPHPIGSEPLFKVNASKADFGVPSDMFCVLALGDLNSSAVRKNLIGAIEIFKRAFPAPGKAILVVKTQAEGEHPRFRYEAAAAADGRGDIRFIEGQMTLERTRSLLASCDVVLSPHRAEGFGLSLAEALMLGRPVLATGWSGNMDFMAGVPEGLIEFKLVPVRDRTGIYAETDQKWAEPDLDDGAAKLLQIADSEVLRRQIVAAGQAALSRADKLWSAGGDLLTCLAPHLLHNSGRG
jgi:glycosyltransferase involved in cell wall biosynthesis